MKTHQERDTARIVSVHKVKTLKYRSFLRVAAVAALTAALGIWHLSLVDGWFANLMGDVLIILALVLIGEGARFGLKFARLYSVWTSITCAMVVFTFCFGIAQLLEHWTLLPAHRTSLWSMLVWIGFVLGVLTFFVSDVE